MFIGLTYYHRDRDAKAFDRTIRQPIPQVEIKKDAGICNLKNCDAWKHFSLQVISYETKRHIIHELSMLFNNPSSSPFYHKAAFL